MARKLRPVDGAPICDRDYLKRIDTVWLRGRVPSGFWEDPAHRRDYLVWLADRLGYRCMADFYRLNLTNDFLPNCGNSIARYWRSALAAVEECFPEYEWMPWLFRSVPKGFWDSPANRRSYLDWLGKELGFRSPEAWYRVQTTDLATRRGGALLQRYASLCDLMREYLPGLAWDYVDVHQSLSIEGILAWTDAYHAQNAKWPTERSGRIPESRDTWVGINACLRDGMRGLPGGMTLARLLQEHRGVRLGKAPPPLSEGQILAWADAHFAAQGRWPMRTSGVISGTQETWDAVDRALRKGFRGLSGAKRSLVQFLGERRAAPSGCSVPPLTEEQILGWADAYFTAHGKWPSVKSGRIDGTSEVWKHIDGNLRNGTRSVGPLSSLALLLAERRGTRHSGLLPHLTEEQILGWADAYFTAHGKWPNREAGPIPGTGETWKSVDSSKQKGRRGLRHGGSLPRLLARLRGVKNHMGVPALSERQILAWADGYFRAEGKWPTRSSGAIAGTEETWARVDDSLRTGGRGLKPGSSLAKLLTARRGARNRACLPPLSEAKIVAWAHRFFLAEGRWPGNDSGQVPQSPGDTWMKVNEALRSGRRGLPGGSSLARLLHERGLK